MTAWGPEDTIQVNILAWLDAVLPDAIVFHIPNGGLRTLQTARKLKRLGTMAGVPDLAILLPEGRIVFVEVKAPTGRLSDEQASFKVRAEQLGHVVIVARSIAEVIESFAAIGVKTHAVAA